MTLEENWQAIQAIDGWLLGNALEPLCLVNAYQLEHAIHGNLCEIGLHHGKLLVSLSHLARPGEIVVGVDVFEDQHLNENHGDCRGDHDKVVHNMCNFGAGGKFQLIKSDSLTVGTTVAFNSKVPYRIFSVDGSHTFRHALNDLHVAANTIATGGVVMLDDYRHPAWPAVETAAESFFEASGRLVPFLLAAGKLFLTTPDQRHGYLEPWLGRGRIERLHGYDVAVC